MGKKHSSVLHVYTVLLAALTIINTTQVCTEKTCFAEDDAMKCSYLVIN